MSSAHATSAITATPASARAIGIQAWSSRPRSPESQPIDRRATHAMPAPASTPIANNARGVVREGPPGDRATDRSVAESHQAASEAPKAATVPRK